MTKPKAITDIQKIQSVEVPVRYDIKRMDAALAAERFTMLQGLSREEKCQHIIASAKK